MWISPYSAPDAGDLLEVRLRVANPTSVTTATGHDVVVQSTHNNITYQAMTTATLDDGMSVTDLLPGGFIPDISGSVLNWGNWCRGPPND